MKTVIALILYISAQHYNYTPVSLFVHEWWSKAAVDMSCWFEQCHSNAKIVAQS